MSALVPPLRVGDRVAATTAALGALAREDAATGGTVIPGERPNAWIADLVADGRLAQPLAVGLCAALLRASEGPAVAEGARLAVRLGEPALGALLLHALDGHDVGLLLQVDPGDPGRSVEDTLLRCAARAADLSDPATREPFLERLRNAALQAEELFTLCDHGTAEELARWLPAILTEGVPAAAEAAVASRLARGDDGAALLRASLASR